MMVWREVLTVLLRRNGRRRLGSAYRRPLRTMTLTLAALVLGLAIGLQVRSNLAILRQLRILPHQAEELAYRLQRREREREDLEASVALLRGRLMEYEAAISAQERDLGSLTRQLHAWKALAGLTDLEGPGIVVELADSARELHPGEDPNQVILHNYDVVAVINEMWTARAEAVAINGERIMPTTPIRSVARTLMVNTKRMTPPLRIEAIGDAERLTTYLRRPDGYVALLQAFQFPVEVRAASHLTIPAYRGPLRFKYLRPSHHQP